MEDRKQTLIFIISMLIFGTIGVFRRFIPLPSAFLAFSRGILGGLFLLLLGKGRGEKIPRRSLAGLVVSGMLIGFNWMLLFEAYNYTTVAVATLCYYMQPTIVVLLSPLIFGEKLTAKKALCAAVAIAGMVLVSGVSEGSAGGSEGLKGIAFGLGAAVLYASVIIMNKKIEGINPYRKTTVQLLSAGLVMVPYLLVSGGFSSLEFTPVSVVLLLIVGIFHTGMAYAMYFGSMEKLSVQSVALLSYIDPVSALFFSAFILGEPLSTAGVIGAVMIIGSAIVSERR
ncbi:MAG: DMT family transporter [Sphaerochaetaceae bacterium]|nr:DMT family transporter [Sphaerochaetaceae bacterium]